MEEHNAEHRENDVGGGNNSITLTPNTGISVAMMITVIGAAVWIVTGQQRMEARAGRLEELVLDLKQSIANVQNRTDQNTMRLADHEAWARSESMRMRMVANENRRKLGLPTIPENVPYIDGGASGRRQ